MAALPILAPEDHVCPTCDLRYEQLAVSAVPEMLRVATSEVRRLAEGLNPDELTRRPEPQTWSALEYLCHIRDVCVASTIRLYRVRMEAEPPVEPLFNDLRVVRFRYNGADPLAVLQEMEAGLDGLLDEMARTSDWDRGFTRQPGERRTARWLVRQALHEVVHHTGDMRLGAEPA
jgi:DinB superfamily